MNPTTTVHTTTRLDITNPAIHTATAQLVHIARELAEATKKTNNLRADLETHKMAGLAPHVIQAYEGDARRWAAHARALLSQLVEAHNTLAGMEAAHLLKAQNGGLLARIKAHPAVAKTKKWVPDSGHKVYHYIDLCGVPRATPFKLWLDESTMLLHQKGDANTLPSSILSLWWDFLDTFAGDFAPGGIESPKPADTM